MAFLFEAAAVGVGVAFTPEQKPVRHQVGQVMVRCQFVPDNKVGYNGAQRCSRSHYRARTAIGPWPAQAGGGLICAQDERHAHANGGILEEESYPRAQHQRALGGKDAHQFLPVRYQAGPNPQKPNPTHHLNWGGGAHTAPPSHPPTRTLRSNPEPWSRPDQKRETGGFGQSQRRQQSDIRHPHRCRQTRHPSIHSLPPLTLAIKVARRVTSSATAPTRTGTGDGGCTLKGYPGLTPAALDTIATAWLQVVQ